MRHIDSGVPGESLTVFSKTDGGIGDARPIHVRVQVVFPCNSRQRFYFGN